MKTENKMTTRRKISVAVGLLVVVIALMIFSGIGASMRGAELHALEKEISSIEARNRELRDEIVGSTSLTNLYENAEELGFVNPEQVVYATGDQYVASLPQRP